MNYNLEEKVFIEYLHDGYILEAAVDISDILYLDKADLGIRSNNHLTQSKGVLYYENT